jgi:hypothetical protein
MIARTDNYPVAFAIFRLILFLHISEIQNWLGKPKPHTAVFFSLPIRRPLPARTAANHTDKALLL